MQVALIGEYEVTYQAGGAPALVLHHVVRGYDALALGADDTAALHALLAVRQKRIRELGGYRVLLGAGGDLTVYDQAGQRACYLSGDDADRLARLLT